MGVYEWSEKYSTGNSAMDAQHKKLFAYIQDLHDAMQVGKGKETLGSILDGLVEYTRVHFKAEEELLGKLDYAGLGEQLSEHERLTAVVVDLSEKFKQGQAALSVTTSNFLKDWLANHIQGTDFKYRDFLKSKGA
jgi:hemerythrin